MSKLIPLLQLFSLLLVMSSFEVRAQKVSNGFADSNPVDTEPPTRPGVATQLLERFIKAESAVRDSLNHHTFKRDVLLQTIGPQGEVTGEYIRKSQFVFDDHGKRIERVLYHPAPSLQGMKITKEDIQDLAGAQLLGIDITEQNKYRLDFAGADKLDGRAVFAIDVTPLTKPNPHKMRERFFVGRVWADAVTLQIVKVSGKVEPQGKQRFPVFQTWRETAKGDLLFPSFTHADDILRFPRSDVHYRVHVKYYDYKLFASKLTITEIDEPGSSVVTPIRQNSNDALSSDGIPACKTNRTAPPVSRYSWPPDTTVQVYFVRGKFTAEQQQTLRAAMADWNAAARSIGADVNLVYAGETNHAVSCKHCLTVDRKDLRKSGGRYHARFFPVTYEPNGKLRAAWIEFDLATTDLEALQGYMSHELGHGLGLENCTTCKNMKSIMNGFPHINRHNGLTSPSPCDLEVVRRIYDDHRRQTAASIEPVATAASTGE